jgi:hypothetical protein
LLNHSRFNLGQSLPESRPQVGADSQPLLGGCRVFAVFAGEDTHINEVVALELIQPEFINLPAILGQLAYWFLCHDLILLFAEKFFLPKNVSRWQPGQTVATVTVAVTGKSGNA